LKKNRQLVETIRRKPESPIRVRERRQFFIGSHNEALTVAMRVSNERSVNRL